MNQTKWAHGTAPKNKRLVKNTEQWEFLDRIGTSIYKNIWIKKTIQSSSYSNKIFPQRNSGVRNQEHKCSKIMYSFTVQYTYSNKFVNIEALELMQTNPTELGDYLLPKNWQKQARPCHATVWCSNLPQRSAQLITLAVSSFPSVATLLSVRAGEAASDTHTQKLAETVLMHMHTQISITLVYKTQITASNCAYTTQTNISFSKLTLKSFHIEHNHCWPTC